MKLDCRTCGACCVGDLDDGRGYADVTEEDAARMSRHVRRRLVVIRSQWSPSRLQTPTLVTEELGKSCAFLRGTPGRRCSCSIYTTRPDVCREFKPGSARCVSARADLGR